MSITDVQLKKLVGKTISTPDGAGKVTEVGDRFIQVDIKGKGISKFQPRECSIEEKE